MAIIHNASLTPSKSQMLAEWVPRQPWGDDASGLEVIGAFRFDDPDGNVGIETHLVRIPSGRVLQVPVTYRDAPLAGAEEFLISRMNHSVLGERWVYDAPADHIYVRALLRAIFTGESQAEFEYVDPSPEQRSRTVTTHVRGSGRPGSVIPDPSDVDIEIRRVIEPTDEPKGHTLTGTWPEQPTPAVLVCAHLR